MEPSSVAEMVAHLADTKGVTMVAMMAACLAGQTVDKMVVLMVERKAAGTAKMWVA